MSAIATLLYGKNIHNLEFAQSYIQKFLNKPAYIHSENSVQCVFCVFPNNTLLEHIIAKISTLNTLYSTNVYYPYELAEHIIRLNVDCFIKDADMSVVDKIASFDFLSKKGEQKHKNLYSFASKYCSFHEKSIFPMYDKNLQRVLEQYNTPNWCKYFFSKPGNKYKNFVEILRSFARDYGLQSLSLRDLDRFLWLYGKELLDADDREREMKNKKVNLIG